MGSIEIITLCVNLLLGAIIALWVVLIARIAMMMATRPTVREGLDLPVPDDASVSVIVPAHNEERVIDRCAASLRGQTHADLQLIFVLDRCTDRTRDLLEQHAAADDRITIIENDHCPDDWAGKCNAARLGAAAATGDWLLFTDADTKFDQRLVRCAVASATKRGAALLSLLSTLTTGRFFERLCQPMASTFLVRLFPVDRINRDHRSRPFANGQFLLFRREDYEAIGGHEAVKDERLEDLAFSRKIHRSGRRVQCLFADGLLRVSMYGSFAAFGAGWRRIYIEACDREPRRLRRSAVTALAMGVCAPLAGFVGLALAAWLLPGALWWAVAAVALQLVFTGWMYRINGAPVVWAPLAPIGAAWVVTAFRGAANMLDRREPIRWGGREYVLEPRT